jgi:5-carboxymethyl-2-hydroxymuconate isomerase
MPHIVVEYSANIHDAIALPELISQLHDTAIATGVFPRGGTRTRAAKRDSFQIADGHADNGFVHIVLRVGHGRTEAVLKDAAQIIFDAATKHLSSVFEQSPLAISMEVQEIHPVLTFKKNNLHDYVAQRDKSTSPT